MKTQSTKSEDVVKQYALALTTLDLKPIYKLLHTDFRFVYRLGMTGGHGITTQERYIGHLYKTFEAMKEEGKTIKMEFCRLEVEDVDYLSIKLLPPHDRRVIYPMDWQIREWARSHTPETEVFLFPRIKDGLLCKVECFTSIHQFYTLYKKVRLHSNCLMNSPHSYDT